MLLDKKRTLLYLNNMPFEMIENQGRIWEIMDRDLGGYCGRSCSVFFRSKENKLVEIEPAKNICYCIKDVPSQIKLKLFRFTFLPLFIIVLAFRIGYICRENKVNAIVSQGNTTDVLGFASLIAAKCLRIPFVAYEGRNATYLIQSNRNIAYRARHRLEIAILRCADRIILRPGTEDSFTRFFGISPSKIISIPHTTRFHEFVDPSKLPHDLKNWIGDRKLILYYGRFDPDKLVDDVIRAFHIVKKKIDDIALLLIGFGRYANTVNTLKKLVKNLNLDNSVKFANSMPQQKLAAISFRADIHVHPTGGKGLLESAFLGKPVITYNNFSWDYDLIRHMETGLKAEFRNFESIAEKIIHFIEHPDLMNKCGRQLKKIAIKEHDLAYIQEKLASSIEEAIIKSKGAKK